MKKIHTLSSLLEQDSKGTNIELTGSAVTMTKADKVRIKWPYQYSWPAKNPLLGDIVEFVNALNSKKGEGKSILSQIEQTNVDHFVGIATDAASTQNNRLIRKDLGQLNGFVYLFHPNTINKELVPDTKKLPEVAGRFTFVVDSEWKKYLMTDKPAAGTGPGSASASTKKAITKASIVDPDGDNYAWFNKDDENGISVKFLTPTANTLQKTLKPVTLLQSGPTAEIFWTFMSNLPPNLATVDLPSISDRQRYGEVLQAAIQKLLAEAAKFDSTFKAVNTNTLNSGLYEDLAYALIIIGLNRGELTNTSTKESARAYYNALIETKNRADAFEKDLPAASATTTSTSTTGFDGTAVNNEMDLAKIISGGLIGYKVPATEVDTLDKIKAKWDSYVPANYEKKFSEIVAKLPFKQNDANIINLPEFKDVQFFAIGVNGKFGPKTVAGFKSAFEKSALK